jgi:hypothetical protein
MAAVVMAAAMAALGFRATKARGLLADLGLRAMALVMLA